MLLCERILVSLCLGVLKSTLQCRGCPVPSRLQEDTAPSAVIWYFVLSSSFDLWPAFMYCTHPNYSAGKLVKGFSVVLSTIGGLVLQS